MRNNSITRNNKKLFEQLVKSNMKKAYFAAIALVGSHDAAMELSQSAFVRAYNHFDKFEKDKSFFAWYYKILKNLCLNFLRDTKKNSGLDSIELSNKKSSDNPNVKLELLEQREIINDALQKLSVGEREIIVLKEFQNFSYKELSEILDIPIGSVMSKLFYARKQLAKNLDLRDFI